MKTGSFLAKVKKGVRNPLGGARVLSLIIRGAYYKSKYKLLKGNVTIGRGFKVRSKLSIRGPGKVVIGDNVVIDGSSHTVTPWTYSRDAIIIIGDNVFLNGTRFGCKEKIEIGENCIIADCRILDTDFHSIYPERRNDEMAVQSAPIRIGNDVWISLDCVILKGVTIGEGATVSAKSVVYKDVRDYCVYGGNPAVLMKEIDRPDD